MNNTFWLSNPKILFDNYLEFIPNNNMTETEYYNSCSLFLIYSMIIIYVFLNRKLLWIPIILLIIIIIFNYSKDNKEHFNSELKFIPAEQELSYNNTINNVDQPIKPKDINKVELGYYDFDNKLVFDRMNSNKVNSTYKFKNNLTYECRKPTDNNPFMNPDITDYFNSFGQWPKELKAFQNNQPLADYFENTPKIVRACNDDTEQPDMIKSFDKKVFKNIEDVISGDTSIRQFYTVPNTEVPNHQSEFAEWLYKAPTTCKEDQSKCLRQEDLRFKKSVFI